MKSETAPKDKQLLRSYTLESETFEYRKYTSSSRVNPYLKYSIGHRKYHLFYTLYLYKIQRDIAIIMLA